jgi:hypothetical protein
VFEIEEDNICESFKDRTVAQQMMEVRNDLHKVAVDLEMRTRHMDKLMRLLMDYHAVELDDSRHAQPPCTGRQHLSKEVGENHKLLKKASFRDGDQGSNHSTPVTRGFDV